MKWDAQPARGKPQGNDEGDERHHTDEIGLDSHARNTVLGSADMTRTEIGLMANAERPAGAMTGITGSVAPAAGTNQTIPARVGHTTGTASRSKRPPRPQRASNDI